MIVHYFKQQVKKGILFAGSDITEWGSHMTKSGSFVDHFWLQGCANYVGADIILLPTFSESCTEIGRIIRISTSQKRHDQPLFLGYIEDNLYEAGHFQALEPENEENAILNYIGSGEAISEPVQSSSFPILTSAHVPLANMPESDLSAIALQSFRNRFLTEGSENVSSYVLNSTKRPRDDDTLCSASKRSKLDTTKTCHICHFKMRKNNRKKRCYCKKIVHNSCFQADGSMCQ